MKVGEWPRVSLSSVSVVFTDGDWIESKDQSPTGIRLIQTGNVGVGEFKDRAEKARYISEDTFRRLRCEEIYEGDCLVSRLPDPVGRACIIPTVEERLITAVDCTIIRFNTSKICPNYFRYFSQSAAYLADIESVCTGATRKRISRNKLGEIRLPLPPVPEQKRIVAILDEAFEGIATAVANAEKNLANARELFDSYLNSIFTQKGEGWVEKSLSDICVLISGQHIDAKDYNSERRGVGYLTGPSDFGLINPCLTKWTEHPKRMATAGDILITVKGSGVGKINLLHVSDVAISRQLMAIRCKPADIDYVYAFLTTCFPHFQAISNGAAIPGISREDVLNLRFPMPTEQQKEEVTLSIVSFRSKICQLAVVYEEKLSALGKLKQAILQKAFAGELTARSAEAVQEAAE